MRQWRSRHAAGVIVALWALSLGGPAAGCTDLVLKTVDGAWIAGRSMEFGKEL
jgi:penicillin V acylase-like amidase (Ntn superfamily)